jgi:WD40 repeat protein/DNA-binding SARP family transcriptional activator/energy-coupling factor transporter ATP-binding protein EcfA2
VGIAVLGPLSLDGGDSSLGRRDRVVLSALTVRPGEVLSADRLADAVWGDEPPASSAKVIQGCVVRLRKQLGAQAIETTPAGYRLTVPRDEIDAQRFERATVRARDLIATGEPERAAAILVDALALWRGEPLADLDGWDTARIEVGRLGEMRLEADELYVESSLRSGQHDRVLAKAAVLVSEAPLRERRWALLALAQYQTGRQGDALRTLRRVRSVLNDELGLDPGPEITQLEQAILRQDASLVVTAGLPDPGPECPYPGLMAYEVADAHGFFGRDEDVSACLRRLREALVLAVVGPSGSGKSSLVRAGVAATLERDGGQVELMTPGPHPLDALANLSSTTGNTLLVDQCEEVFSLCSDPRERAAFLSALARRAETRPVIVALRADRLVDVAAHPDFARVVERGLFLIAAMAESDLREAIEGPARNAGLVVEPGLVDVLVHEAAHPPGALPMLSHALAETWQRREGRTLTVAGYHASGGIRGAVAKSAEDIYTQVGAEQQTVLREMLLRLVSPGDDGEPVRVRLPRRLVITDPAHDEMVDMLIASRLVTSDDGVIELAHEALARAWPRLRGWLDEDVDGQRILHHLAVAAEAWDALGRPESELYRGVRLSTAVEWRRRSGQALSELEQAFLDDGERVADSERVAAEEHSRRQNQVNRRLRGLLSIAVTLMLATVLAGLLATRQASRADQEGRAANAARQRADAAALSADAKRLGARALTESDISLSMLLAVQGVKMDDSPEARANLLAALAKRPQLIRTGIGDGPYFAAVAGTRRPYRGFVAGRRLGPQWVLATSDGTNQMHFYDQFMKPLSAHALGKRHPSGHDVSVAFSSRGSLLAAGMNTLAATPVKLFNSATQQPRTRQLAGFPGQPSAVADLDFSGNGRYLAGTFVSSVAGGRSLAGSQLENSANFALVWDLRRPNRPRRVPLPAGPQGLAVAPSGDVIYTSWPLTAYDVSSGKVRWRSPITGRGHLDINGAGSLLAMPEWDERKNNNIVVVDTTTGQVRRRLSGHSEQVGDVRFSPDGASVASVADDDTVTILGVRQGNVQDRLETGHVNAIAFSPDGGKLITAGEDAALRLWDLRGGERYIARTGTGQAIPILRGMVHSTPDGRALAYSWSPSEGDTYRLRFYDVVTDTLGPVIDTEESETIGTGVWRADRKRYVTVGQGVIQIWNPDTATLIKKQRVGGPLLTSVAFSGDDRQLLVTDRNGLVRMFDARTLNPVGASVDLNGDACCIAVGTAAGEAVVFSDPSDGEEDSASLLHTQWNRVDLRTGTLLGSREIGVDVLAADVSPDGRRVAVTGTSGEMWLLEMETGKPERRGERGHDRPADRVSFSEDGEQVVTTAVDGTVSLWNGRSGALQGTVGLPDRTPLVASFLYGGQDLLLASASGGIYSWDSSEHSAIAFACALAGRTLTRTEWRTLIGGPYRPKCPLDASAAFILDRS